jgi:hypothetical protein
MRFRIIKYATLLLLILYAGGFSAVTLLGFPLSGIYKDVFMYMYYPALATYAKPANRYEAPIRGQVVGVHRWGVIIQNDMRRKFLSYDFLPDKNIEIGDVIQTHCTRKMRLDNLMLPRFEYDTIGATILHRKPHN